ncbi:MAG: V-type ATP synthase subunit B [Acholeplasmatales bacterium]|jgi:V/A-type H+-transporting ATPase subunit B|nr:V-type ATP synthase subunit B [Acholeplasmatales bacterium]
MNVYHVGVQKIDGSIIFVESVLNPHFDEEVEIIVSPTDHRRGRIVVVEGSRVGIQVFEGSTSISLTNTKTKLLGNPMQVALSETILGRVFNGVQEPKDGLGNLLIKEKRDINSSPINPVSRVYPRNYINTGFSSIDGLTTLIRGQKLPIFSVSGVNHNRLISDIIVNAQADKDFCIIFCAIGIKNDTYLYFMDKFINAGIMNRTVMYINTLNDPIIERIIAPRCALTTAEYLAFTLNKNVLVIMSDMTAYCEALREISASRGEIPGRKGFPGYMYSDLSSLYERAGIIKGSTGSITQIPLLTMPNEDITHPIADLTGYITEGQIVLSKELEKNNIFPPIAILPSLSRLMKDGIGSKYTRSDHQALANQLYASYSRVMEIRSLAKIIGEDELSKSEKALLSFGSFFEKHFINQSSPRNIVTTLNLGWKLLSLLEKEDLTVTKDEYLQSFYHHEEALAYFDSLKDHE